MTGHRHHSRTVTVITGQQDGTAIDLVSISTVPIRSLPWTGPGGREGKTEPWGAESWLGLRAAPLGITNNLTTPIPRTHPLKSKKTMPATSAGHDAGGRAFVFPCSAIGGKDWGQALGPTLGGEVPVLSGRTDSSRLVHAGTMIDNLLHHAPLSGFLLDKTAVLRPHCRLHGHFV